MNINGMRNKEFLIASLIKTILLIAGVALAEQNNVIKWVTICYTIYMLIGTTYLLFKTNNFFKEILWEDFDDRINQIGIWISMGITMVMLLGLIFSNPVMKVIAFIGLGSDLISAVWNLIETIKEEKMWSKINLDYEFINAMAAMAEKTSEAEDTEE